MKTKNRLIISVLIVIITLFASFFSFFVEYPYRVPTKVTTADDYCQLESDVCFCEPLNLIGVENNITSLRLQFRTDQKVRKGLLCVELCENEIVLDSWSVDTAELVNEQCRTFELSTPIG